MYSHKHVLLQVICDADLTIVNCVVKWPGSVHDARILRESALYADSESQRKPLSGFILGDSSYMLRDWLLTPIVNPVSAKDHRYNAALCGTRCTVERCIGVLKRRWHCLHTELRVSPQKACKMITACVVLHNRAMKLNHPVPADLPDCPPTDPPCDDHDTMQSTQPSEQARIAAAKVARQRLIDQHF